MTLSLLVDWLDIAIRLFGAVSGLHAVLYTRTAPGAVAWLLTLVFIPYFAVPLYWLFGPRKYKSYISNLSEAAGQYRSSLQTLEKQLAPFQQDLNEHYSASDQLLRQLSSRSPTGGNKVRLLVNGERTFKELFHALTEAREFICLQSYILRDDATGQRLKQMLVEASSRGVRVLVLFDGFGSLRLSGGFISELRSAGIEVHWFRMSPGLWSRFSVNFRNHRKLAVIDGCSAFIGGHNIGDEYLSDGTDTYFWRDTHVRIDGPAARVVLATFARDWHFVTGERLNLGEDIPVKSCGSQTVLPFASGPTSDLEPGSFMFLEAISASRRRFWITSPYFVPDEPIVQELQLAALRGVDVRILLPSVTDQYLSWLAGHSYYDEMLTAGVRLFRYESGFLHQKVFLVDEYWSCVGTANLDNRSMRLNFEMSTFVFDKEFAREMEQMILRDLDSCQELKLEDITAYSLPFQLTVSFARLFAPVL